MMKSLMRGLLAATLAITGVAVAAVTQEAPAAHAACAINASTRSGARNEATRCIQQTLTSAGLNPGPVDGVFGNQTRNAVMQFQRSKGLYVDGVVGPQTAARMGIWGTPKASTPAASPAATPAPSANGSANCSINSSVNRGARGTAAKCVQQALKSAGLNPGPIDGIFGNQTRNAVMQFQRSKGLYVDGSVGPQTGRTLGIWGSSTSTPAATTPASSTCKPGRTVPSSTKTVINVNAWNSQPTKATVTVMTRSGNGWTCSNEMTGRVGKSGVMPLEQRVAGNGTTPGGVFPVGTLTAPNGDNFSFFGNGNNPGVNGGWHQVRTNDCIWLDPGTSAYNTLISKPQSKCGGGENEYLPEYQTSYSRAVLIGANMGSGRSGDAPGETPRAGGIFLHAHSYDGNGNSRPTAGCVSLAGRDLDVVLTRINPVNTTFVITS